MDCSIRKPTLSCSSKSPLTPAKAGAQSNAHGVWLWIPADRAGGRIMICAPSRAGAGMSGGRGRRDEQRLGVSRERTS